MLDDDDVTRKKLDRLFERINGQLPGPLSNTVDWLIKPTGRFVRIPFGILCVIGGIFSFLPILGLWMLPLGIMLLAIDIPPIRRWVVRKAPKIEARWRAWRLKRLKASRNKAK